ncbi:MAG: DNA-3-methyladenine glycosylase [Chloroflexota bacterium]|nr:DNA-3-methyladenine glycosylase [Chloroflexota bacterium]
MVVVGSAVAVQHLRAADPIMARIIDLVGPFNLRSQPSHFYALLSSIVSQQISTKAAATILGRVVALFPSAADLTPLAVLALGPEPLRIAGLSGMKARYVLDLSERVSDGRLDLSRLETLEDEAVIAELLPVKGIGRWTAEMFLIFSLGRLDVLPVDDLGLRLAVQRHYSFPELPQAAQIRTLATPWAPYRTVATWYLWRSLVTMP